MYKELRKIKNLEYLLTKNFLNSNVCKTIMTKGKKNIKENEYKNGQNLDIGSPENASPLGEINESEKLDK